jgi:PIN domain nuclease of toxin-antitoxin system
MALVLDTHALIWYLSGSKELSRVARTIIATEEKNGASIPPSKFFVVVFSHSIDTKSNVSQAHVG